MTNQTENISNKKYHYFYKITNNINGMFYYGIHSTNNIDDGYMGSGHRIKLAIKKYGVENFTKEIIKFFSSLKELSNYEQQIVNESLLNDPNCYNLVKGGYFLDNDALVKRKNSYNNIKHQKGKNNSQYGTCWVTKNEVSIKINTNLLSEYINTGWVKKRLIKNKTNIANANRGRRHMWKDGRATLVYECDIEKYINDGWVIGRVDPNTKFKPSMTKEESIHNASQHVKVRDNDGNIFVVKRDDPRYLSGELVYFSKGMINVIDKHGNKLWVKIDDPRYLSGELHANKNIK